MGTVWARTNIEKDNTDVCQFCESIIKDVRDFVDDKKNQQEVQTFLTNACNIIPDEQLANLCKTSVTEEFEQLIQMIDSELDPAVICSAMGLCSGFKDKVQHRPVQKESTDVCEFCQAIIRDIRAFVDDKQNEQQVKDMLNNLCSMIPNPDIANVCKDSVDAEIDQLIQMIDSQLDPSVVCKKLQLCSATKKQSVEVADTPLCDKCTKFMMEVKSKLSDTTTEKEVQDLIETDLCSKAGQYEAVCKLAVETYLPQLMQMLSSDVGPATICSALGFCNSTQEARTLLAKLRLQKSPVYEATPAGGAEECLLCKTVLGELQNFDRSEAVQKEVEDFLRNNLCKLLGTLESVCEQTVLEFGPELFELLANELDPEETCSALGFCSARSIEAVLRSVLPVSMPKSHPPEVPAVAPGKKFLADPSTECVLCEFVIKTLDSQLSDNATEEEIVKALDEVCGVLPDTIKAPCEQFVQQYGPTVIALLLQELDPQEVCTKLGLCTSFSSLHASTECVLCEFVMTEIDQLLQKNRTESEILAALNKVCSILPSTISPDCTDFVDTYGRAVLALLQQELDPAVICSVLGLCRQQKDTKPNFKDAEVCGVCETVIQYIDGLLLENATLVEIRQALDKVCNFLPDTLKQQCDDVVKEYGPALVEMIAQYLDPREICTSVGLCTNTTLQAEAKEIVMKGEEDKEGNSVDFVKIVPAKVQLLGEDDCTMGPAFWCLNMENANECDKVSYCKQKVWN